MTDALAKKSRHKEEAPEPRGRGRPVGDRAAKRAELLDAAISLIAEDGFAGVSLRKVAERAGTSTGAVTYYFANKEALMAAVLESRFDIFDAMLKGREGEVDVKTGLQRWLDWTKADMPGEWLASFQMLAQARHDPALAEVFQRRYARYRAVFAALLAKGQRQGSIRTDIRADLLADQLSAMGDGWMMLFPIEPERFQPSRVSALLDATIALISPPAAKRKSRS
ncbi:MAG TPA: TetR/AcrR family transcriptional regulator [Rhizomicrobium sp.]